MSETICLVLKQAGHIIWLAENTAEDVNATYDSRDVL